MLEAAEISMENDGFIINILGSIWLIFYNVKSIFVHRHSKTPHHTQREYYRPRVDEKTETRKGDMSVSKWHNTYKAAQGPELVFLWRSQQSFFSYVTPGLGLPGRSICISLITKDVILCAYGLAIYLPYIVTSLFKSYAWFFFFEVGLSNWFIRIFVFLKCRLVQVLCQTDILQTFSPCLWLAFSFS